MVHIHIGTVAGWATILAAVITFGTWWTTIASNRKQNATKVQVSTGLAVETAGPYIGNTQLSLGAYNLGGKTIILSSYGFILKNKFTVYPHGTNLYGVHFPFALAPGANCEMTIDIRDFALGLYEHGFRGEVKLVSL